MFSKLGSIQFVEQPERFSKADSPFNDSLLSALLCTRRDSLNCSAPCKPKSPAVMVITTVLEKG